MSLLETTHSLLKKAVANGNTLPQIAENSRGRVNYEWLKKFAARKIPNPGVVTIEQLNETLLELEVPEKRKRA